MTRLPMFSAEAASKPLPESVAAIALELGQRAAGVLGHEYANRPGQALEWISSGPISDRYIRELMAEAGQWVEHAGFGRQFASAFTAAVEPAPDDEPFSSTSGTIGMSTQDATTNPEPIDRTTVSRSLAAVLATAYGGQVPNATDERAADAVLRALAALLEQLAYDPNIVAVGSPMTAITNLARLFHGARPGNALFGN